MRVVPHVLLEVAPVVESFLIPSHEAVLGSVGREGRCPVVAASVVTPTARRPTAWASIELRIADDASGGLSWAILLVGFDDMGNPNRLSFLSILTERCLISTARLRLHAISVTALTRSGGMPKLSVSQGGALQRGSGTPAVLTNTCPRIHVSTQVRQQHVRFRHCFPDTAASTGVEDAFTAQTEDGG